jgi:lipocalin-like protein
MRSDLAKFASNNRAQATAEGGKAVAQGKVALYGTYKINEGDKTLTTGIEGSSFPNLIGGKSGSLPRLQRTNCGTSISTRTKAEPTRQVITAPLGSIS